jgi:hypothetical protein
LTAPASASCGTPESTVWMTSSGMSKSARWRADASRPRADGSARIFAKRPGSTTPGTGTSLCLDLERRSWQRGHASGETLKSCFSHGSNPRFEGAARPHEDESPGGANADASTPVRPGSVKASAALSIYPRSVESLLERRPTNVPPSLLYVSKRPIRRRSAASRLRDTEYRFLADRRLRTRLGCRAGAQDTGDATLIAECRTRARHRPAA